jgi:hypothetical protein
MDVLNEISKGDCRVSERTERVNDASPVKGPSTHHTPEEYDELQIHGMKIALAMKRGNDQMAHQLVDSGMAEMHARDRSPILDTPLIATGIELMVCNALDSKFDCTTIGQALALDMALVRALPNMGTLRVEHILSRLASYAYRRIIQL